MRAAIYARYSSDAQSAASIEDQIRLCKERLAAEGWELAQVFRDAAMSGASTLRAGYQGLLEGAREAAFDVLVAESLDRLSRDQEDVAGLYKRLRFAGIRLVTLAEGEVSELHVGLKGTMNALFLKDLADKTRRGLRGRVEAGRSAGGLAYGYRVVRELDATGKPVTGQRTIDAAEATTVRRIFTRFSDGESPLAIAKSLNAEGVPGPGGRAWGDTTIRGHALRGTGILRNELYVGRLIWNRMRYIKDPASGRRVSRMNPDAQWIAEEDPALRVVEQALWDRTQARLAGIRERNGANAPGDTKFWMSRRAGGVLTGKVFCGCCKGTLAAIGRDYLACGRARRQGVCENRRGIRRGNLEAFILDALRTRLMEPELVAEFIRAFTAEWNRLAAERGAAKGAKERELAAVTRKLDGLIAAMADGFRGPRLQAQMDELEGKRAALEAEATSVPASQPLRLHPNLAEVYRARVADLQTSLRSQDGGRAALERVRGLIERIEVTPAAEGPGFEIDLTGELAALVRLGMGASSALGTGSDRGMFWSSVKVVAGTGFEPVTFRL